MLLAQTLILMKRDVIALMIILLFETYLRPSELLALTPEQIIEGVPNAQGAARWLTLLVHPEEHGVTNKVNEYDHSVPLDLQRHQFLVEPLISWTRRRPAGARLWTVEYPELAHMFSLAVQHASVDVLRPTLYGLRHGGASHDRSVRCRGLPEVQSRGGWRSFSSVRRYEKHGRLGAQLNKLAAKVRLRADQAETFVRNYFGRNFGKN